MTGILESILNWARGTASRTAPRVTTAAPAQKRTDMTGEYLSLYTYLVNRYANTVVLTFGQIESLVGFALPDLARTDVEWWSGTRTSGNAAKAPQSDAWILASRTATPNLGASIVTFERWAGA
jgi:hypothetical protein